MDMSGMLILTGLSGVDETSTFDMGKINYSWNGKKITFANYVRSMTSSDLRVGKYYYDSLNQKLTIVLSDDDYYYLDFPGVASDLIGDKVNAEKGWNMQNTSPASEVLNIDVAPAYP